GCVPEYGAPGTASQGDRVGRDRAGLLLRSFAARGAEGGFQAANGAGDGGETAYRDSLSSIGGQRQGLGRLFRPAARPLVKAEFWRNSALLHGEPAASRKSARYGLHDFIRRQRDISQGPADS